MALNFDHQRDRISSSSSSIALNINGAFTIPVGTTAQRPSVVATGQIRFNSQQQTFEGYNGAGWSTLGGVVDVDQDTKITAEQTPGSDEDTLTFITAGTDRLTVNSSGNFAFGDGLNKFTIDFATGDTNIAGNLDVAGNIGLTGNITIGGNLNGGDADTDTVTLLADVTSNITPDASTTYDLGTNSKSWRTLYVDTVLSNTGLLTLQNDVVDIDGSGAIIIPVGATGDRPATLAQGMIRYNTTDSTFEGYDGTNWGSLGGVKDVDQDTYIIAESSAGADNDQIDFYTSGTQALQLDSDGDLKFGDGLNKFVVDWATGDTTITGLVTLDSTGALVIPVGTNAQRPSTSSQGMIRYNTDGNTFEGYDGTNWGSLGGVIDVDQDTYIKAETSAGTDNDDLDFYTAGTQRMQIDQDGDFKFGNTLTEITVDGATGDTVFASTTTSTSSTTGAVKVSGGVGVAENINVGGNADITGTLNVDGNTTLNANVDLGDDVTSDVTSFNSRVDTDIMPTAGDTRNLGTSTYTWRNIYLSRTAEFSGASGVNELVIPTNQSDALSLRDTAGTPNDIIVVDTTTGAQTLSIVPDAYLNGNVYLGDDIANDTTTFNSKVDSHIIPNGADTYTLGNGTDTWKEINLSEAVKFYGATSENEILFPTNLSDGLSITDGVTDFVVFTSTTSANKISVTPWTAFAGDVDIGDADTDTLTVTAKIDSNLIPSSGDTYDLGSSTDTWKAIYLSESVNFLGATTENEIVVPTNLADALSVKDSAGDLIVITTTTGSQLINITPQTQMSSANVTDLTDGRVVLAGTSGELQDSPEFTYSQGVNAIDVDITGSLDVDNINIDGNAIISTNTNGDINITPDGTGEVVISTATVSDLTDNRIVIAGTSGALEDDANFRFNGTSFQIGASGSEVFDVTVASGNTAISGDVTISGDLQVDGTTTTVNSTTVTIDDPVFTLGGDAAPSTDDNKDRGIEFNWYDGEDATPSAKVGFFGFDDSSRKFTFIPDATNSSEVFSGDVGDAAFGDMDLGSATINSIQLGITASNEIDTTAGNLVLDSFGGTVEIDDNLTVSGTLDVTGESTLSSAIISDLTAGRVVLASTAGAVIDSAEFVYTQGSGVIDIDITGSLDVDNINIDGNTIISTDTNGDINITPNGTGEVIISTATISDLTSGRVVLAGTDGAVEDNANLTYDGTDLSTGSLIVTDLTDNRILLAGTNGAVEDDSNFRFDGSDFMIGAAASETFQVNVSNGNTAISGTLEVSGTVSFTDTAGAPSLNVDGSANIASAAIEDLTNNRIVLAGTGGELEDDGNLTFDGTSLNVGAGNFIVAVSDGNTAIAGTLDVDGQVTVASANIEDLTDEQIVIAGTDGELEGDANFRFNGTTFDIGASGSETFQVTVASGNTTVSGTLDVTGDGTFNSNVDVQGSTSSTNSSTGALVVAGGVGIGGDLNVGGDVSITGNLTIGGDTTGGDADTDSVTFVADVSSNIIPDTNDTYDLGETGKGWKDLYLTESITFEGATGENEIVLPIDQSDALSVTDGTSDLITINTDTAGTPNVTIAPAFTASTNLTVGTAAGTTTVTSILDEDSMSSDSDTALATQQSIKAFVEAQDDAQDLDFSGDTGTGSVLINSQSFAVVGTTNEIETSANAQTLTIGLPDDVTIGNNLTVTNDASVNNDLTVGGNATVTGDLTVSGTTTYINTQTLNIGDNIITLNADLDSGTAPTENAGIEVNRGSSTDVSFVWDETSDRWVADGDLGFSGDLYGTIDGGTF